MGVCVLELIGGVDCLEMVRFFDVVYFFDFDNLKIIKNVVCVFELDSGILLRCYFEIDGKDGYKFYGGLVGYLFVFWIIIIVENYDSIFDFMFYQNGVIEVKVMFVGYLFFDNYEFQVLLVDSFGDKVYSELVGDLYDYIFYYKVDLDVYSKLNLFQIIEIIIKFLFLGDRMLKVFCKNIKCFEEDVKFFKINFDLFIFYNIYSDNENKFGLERGYFIELQLVVK